MSLYTTPILNINLKKVVENYSTLKALASKSISSAVVKDDAYGLGATQIANVLYKTGCRHFFVAHATEGQQIRPYVPKANIYVLQGVGQDSYDIIKQHNLIPVISSPQMLKYFQKHPLDNIKPIIQVETGLNRLGFSIKELERLSQDELNSFSFVLSHLSCGDEQAHFMNTRQLTNFKFIKEHFFKNTPATLSASDGVFLGDDFHFDMVRLGAAMYGINTAPYRLNEMHNVIEVKAPVLQIKNLDKGEFVGYSATFRSPHKMKIAIISIGYGDGIPRSLSNKGKVVFYQNKKPVFCPIIGRISMDNIICDITNLQDVTVGSYAYLINKDYTLDDIARDAGTIAYEIISNLGKANRYIKTYQK